MRLVYQDSSGVEGCLDEQGLRRAIAEHAGYDPILEIAPDTIVVTLTRGADRVAARVDLLDANHAVLGTRSIDAGRSDCGELLQAVALSVGIALDRIERAAPPAGAAPVVPVAPPSTSPEPGPSAPAPSRTRRPTIDVAAGLSAWVGTAPTLALAPTALVAARWGNIDVGLEGRFELPASATEGQGAWRVRTSLAGGGPQVCFHLQPLFTCAVSFVGPFGATAPDTPGTDRKTGVDVYAGARVGGALPVGAGFSLRLAVDLLANLDRYTVWVAGQDAWRPSLIAAGAQFGIGWTIP